jgi:hypothetical protein
VQDIFTFSSQLSSHIFYLASAAGCQVEQSLGILSQLATKIGRSESGNIVEASEETIRIYFYLRFLSEDGGADS